MKNAVAGQDIVCVNLAGNLEAIGNNITRAMKETKVRWIIAISSIGIYDKPLKQVLVPWRKLADIIGMRGKGETVLIMVII